ncbi:hypothetical protein PYCC9005_003835 [Savitreella phatthalungensis]
MRSLLLRLVRPVEGVRTPRRQAPVPTRPALRSPSICTCRRPLTTSRSYATRSAPALEEEHIPNDADNPADTAVAEGMRSAFSRFAQPVCVITTGGNDVVGRRGMTVSSVVSVSVTGSASLLAFNVRLPSRGLQAMVGPCGFAVHMLRDTPTERALAAYFAAAPIPLDIRHHISPTPLMHALLAGDVGPDDNTAVWEAAGVWEMSEEREGIPMLKKEISTGPILRCSVERVVEVGDHALVIARVHETLRTAGGDRQRDKALVYLHHGFHGVTGSS